MIVMVESGRLGNQIFQYVALSSARRKNERLVLIGFEELRQTFSGLEATFIPMKGTPLIHLMSLPYESLSAKEYRWLDFIKELPDGSIVRTRRHAIATPSWFQTGYATSLPAFARMSVKEPHQIKAARILEEAGFTCGQVAFVHVRGGDYRTWPSPEAPAILEPDWYLGAIREFKLTYPKLPFILLGDDEELIGSLSASVPGAVVPDADAPTSLAIMEMCRGGVMSASSFAFWGAALAHRNFPDGLFLAPKFWIGHRTGVWFPRPLLAPMITYLEL
jgi:hypothetical protein